ncbi:MAG: winged helix-turn-helix domain-containing protein [Candidatus Hydrogenedentes bacterium]|nr:winged helix-turn-helix domain-containing protein [Candidatus Hydrogenedentota bacterium]
MRKAVADAGRVARGVNQPPAPEDLKIQVDWDRKENKAFWRVTEGATDHYASDTPLASEADAQADGREWLAQYAKASAAGRRKMLGWKPSASKKSSATASTEVSPSAADTAPETTPPMAEGERVAVTKRPRERARRAGKPSGLDVAAQVLRAAGTPMTAKDLVETMLSKGLWTTGGKTPAATIYAAIIREIARKGPANQSRFTKTDRGLFTFNAQVATPDTATA